MDQVPSAWVSIVIGVLSSLVSVAVFGAIAFAALKSWMARREEREISIERRVIDLEGDFEKQGLMLQNHGQRLSVLEDRQRRQPMDYAAR